MSGEVLQVCYTCAAVRIRTVCGCHHTKIYFEEDGICANVIRHLRIFGSPVDFNGIIYTICTN